MSKPSKVNQRCDYIFKFVVLGDSAVGKTNILLCFTQRDYKPTHLPTIGVDFKIKIVEVQDKIIKLQLWDTAGQQRFKTITQTYYKNASGIILVYSVSDRKSYNNISNWISQISQRTEQTIPKILLGNKCDVQGSERCVSIQQGKNLAQKYNIPFFEVSAKQNINISEIFIFLTKRVLKSLQEQCPIPETIMGDKPIKISRQLQNQKGKEKCCLN